MTFENIWEQEERQGLQRRLQQGYPAWLQHRKQRKTMVYSVVVVVVVSFSILNFQFSTHKDYDGVVCNRSGIADSHWAEVAGNILTIETI